MCLINANALPMLQCSMDRMETERHTETNGSKISIAKWILYEYSKHNNIYSTVFSMIKHFFFVLFSAVVLVILFSLSLSISSGLGSGRMRWWKYGNGYYYCDQLAVIGHKINIGNIFIYRFLDAVCLAQQIAAARNGPNVKSGGMMTWTRIVRDLLWY